MNTIRSWLVGSALLVGIAGAVVAQSFPVGGPPGTIPPYVNVNPANGYGQPCAGQTAIQAVPCFPTATWPLYKPPLTGAIGNLTGTPFAAGYLPDYFGVPSSLNPFGVPNFAYSPVPTISGTSDSGSTLSVTGGIKKFTDALPVLNGVTNAAGVAGAANVNGQVLTLATADTTSFPAVTNSFGPNPASDFYEIALVEYAEKMSSSLANPTPLRGYIQLVSAGTPGAAPLTYYGTTTPIRRLDGSQAYAVGTPHYLGPSIVAFKNRPVRVLFRNLLPPTGIGDGGKLPLPVDETIEGAGTDGAGNLYTQNRATLHLHGGASPWISDGTPHQWTAPVGETAAAAKRGPSVAFVPDMWFTPTGALVTACSGQLTCSTAGASNDPGAGSLTFYWTNQQTARLMFYHDHAYGITRENVYAGEAAGYVLLDQTDVDLGALSGLPGNVSGANPGLAVLPDGPAGIPLVIQDKTFVDPSKLASQDPTWIWGSNPAKGSVTLQANTGPGTSLLGIGNCVALAGCLPATPTAGDLWFPHVYMPNQNPSAPNGVSSVGRWDYSSWLYPPITTQIVGPVANGYFLNSTATPDQPPQMPGTPTPTAVPEAFMDTSVVNGTAYPSMTVTPEAHRFRILSVGDDRTLNLSWFLADPVGIAVVNGGHGYSSNTTATMSSATLADGSVAPQQSLNVTVDNVVSDITNANPLAPTCLGALTVTIVNAPSDKKGSGAAAVATSVGTGLTITVTSQGSGYTAAPTVKLSGFCASPPVLTATLDGIIRSVDLPNPPAIAYATAPTITITDTGGGTLVAGPGSGAVVLASPNTEVHMVPAAANAGLPSTWPTDGRNGGAPDPAAIGPNWIQLGNETGWLALPVSIPPQPVTYEYSRRVIFAFNVKDHSLVLGPAERADVLVDFSPYAGQTLILYNDGPAPYPGFDERYDLYTGDPDNQFQGGAPTTVPGYGPNTRTVMQVNVCDPAITNAASKWHCPVPGTVATPLDLTKLVKSWPNLYAQSQLPPLVPQAQYFPSLGIQTPAGWTEQYLHVTDPSLTFYPWQQTSASTGNLYPQKVTVGTQDKAIIENWDMAYGRMNALLGGALPNMGPQAGVAVPYSYFNPPTELLYPTFQTIPGVYPVVGNPGTVNGTNLDGTQIWRLDHQGVDEHSMHFHLVNVQVVNRVALDGTNFPPEPGEWGMKDTIRLKPALDTIIAVRPDAPSLPFPLPNSVHLLDPAAPLGAQMTDEGGVVITNVMQDYGWEYVWHCHLLGHEEHDMMRPLVFIVPFSAPTPTLPAAEVGLAYATQNLHAYGGVSPYTWSLVTGSALPAGLTLSSTGVISGTPTAGAVTSNFTVNVVDSTTPTAHSLNLALSIPVVTGPAISTATLPTAEIGVVYAPQTLAATGGAAPLAWSRSAGTLPGGITLSAAGVISGTPTAAGTFNFTARVADLYGVAATRPLTLVVAAAPAVSVPNPALQNGTVGVVYAPRTLAVTGGVAPFSWSLSAGALPAGLTLSTAGVISGTPTLAGTYAFTVQVKDANAVAATRALSLTVGTGGPATPTGLTAAIASATSVTLSWTDASNNEASFAIWRSVNGAAVAQVGTVTRNGPQRTQTGGTVTFTNTGLAAGNTYAFQVTAIATNGATSLASNTATVVFAAPAVPAAPTATWARIGNTPNDSVNLTWPVVAGATGYRVQRATNAAFTAGLNTQAVATNSTTQTVNRGNGGTRTTYYYRIVATNGALASAAGPALIVLTK